MCTHQGHQNNTFDVIRIAPILLQLVTSVVLQTLFSSIFRRLSADTRTERSRGEIKEAPEARGHSDGRNMLLNLNRCEESSFCCLLNRQFRLIFQFSVCGVICEIEQQTEKRSVRVINK